MIRNAIIVTIILHSLIIVGVPEGHGFGIMLMFDVVSIPLFVRNGFQFNILNEFDSRLIIAGLLSIIAKLGLITSLFLKGINLKNITRILSLLIILASFLFILNYNWEDLYLTIASLIFGIPFLLYWSRILYLMKKQNA